MEHERMAILSTVSSMPQMLPSDPHWITFVESNADAGIFHHPAWSQLMVECYGYRPFIIAVPEKGAKFAAGVPLMEINSPITGRRWVSLPFSDYCDPLYTDKSALQELVEQITRCAAQNKISNLELRGIYPVLASSSAYSKYVIHKIDLGPGEQKVWAHIHEMHRRNVKIARENDVKVVLGDTLEHLEEFYHLHLLTRRRQGVPIQPKKFFEILKRLLLDRELGFLSLAYKDGQCIAGAIFLHWKKTLTYKFGASRDDNLKYRPNNLVMWSAIQWGCEHGYTCFDMGRTDLANTGLRTFKDRWGAREMPLFYTSLGANSSSVGKQTGGAGKIEKTMHVILQNSPAWVCRLTGELLYKHFG
jgi:CelD/BcsL family acetyltransferase involved in cellulose biosynthesis